MTDPLALQWQDGVDFVALALFLYLIIRWAAAARAMRIAIVIALIQAGAIVADYYGLAVTAWVLHGASILFVLMLMVVFQRELRSAFLPLGGWLSRGVPRKSRGPSIYRQIAAAAFELASNRTGALIVLVRNSPINELTEGGVDLNAELSTPLLVSIFQKNSPLHDGAAQVEGDRIRRANVVLPLTQEEDIPASYGTRHRAAHGLAAHSDAIVVAVSEETGAVRLFSGSRVEGFGAEGQLARVLQLFDQTRGGPLRWDFQSALTKHLDAKIAAALLAGLVFVLPYSGCGTLVRNVEAPITFSNVPAGMEVVLSKGGTVRVQLRGRRFRMEGRNFDNLVARIDLKGAEPGDLELELQGRDLGLPHGIVAESFTPSSLHLSLKRRAAQSPPTGASPE